MAHEPFAILTRARPFAVAADDATVYAIGGAPNAPLDDRPSRVSHEDVAGSSRVGWVVLVGLGPPGVAAWLVLAPGCSSAATMDQGLVTAEHAATAATELPPLQDAGAAAALEATRIIAASRAAYAACRTYEDDGTYSLVFRGRGQRGEKTFHTAFAGPNAIRFAYVEEDGPPQPARFYELVADGAGVRAKVPWAAQPETQKSLEIGIAGFTGISGGLAVAILPLLPSGLRTLNALDVSEPRLTGQAEVDGAPCDVLGGIADTANGRSGPRVQVWIARSDSLIRRVVADLVQTAEDLRRMADELERHWPEDEASMRDAGETDAHIAQRHAFLQQARAFSPISTFKTTTYHPRCNQPIAPEALRATDGGL